jgi:hypothetical protein
VFLPIASLGGGAEHDGVAEAFELGDQASGVGFCVAAHVPVRSEVAVGLVALSIQ